MDRDKVMVNTHLLTEDNTMGHGRMDDMMASGRVHGRTVVVIAENGAMEWRTDKVQRHIQTVTSDTKASGLTMNLFVDLIVCDIK